METKRIERLVEVSANESLLCSVKVYCDWMRINPHIIATCAKVTSDFLSFRVILISMHKLLFVLWCIFLINLCLLTIVSVHRHSLTAGHQEEQSVRKAKFDPYRIEYPELVAEKLSYLIIL